MSLLSVRNVRVTYGKVVALDGVSLTVESGELVTLVGANGAGKSTLMKTITGLVRPLAGEIEFEGRSLIGRETYDIARLGIAYVPEGRGTLRELSVRENLRLGAFARAAGLPPEKWSSLMYGLWPDGGLKNAKEETHG